MLYLVLLMFCENKNWSFRRVFEHIKFKDFQVFDFALFYYGLKYLLCFGGVIKGHIVNLILVLIMLCEN